MILVVIAFFLSFASLSCFAAEDKTEDVSKNIPPDGIYLIRPELSDTNAVDFRPEFVTGENLLFYTCLEGIDTAYSSIVCEDDYGVISELPTHPWKWGCFISYFDLNETTCPNLVIQTEYPWKDEIQRISDKIVLKNFNSIPYDVLLDQDNDGGWGDAVSTAYSLWVFSTFNREHFENTYQEQIEDGMTWLKDNRDEELKCWPEDECNIKITAMILAFLTQSGFEDDPVWYRIVHDAKIWLESQQNIFDPVDPSEGDPSPYEWTFMITGENWTIEGSGVSINYTDCILTYADEIDQAIKVPFDQSLNFSFTPIHNEQFDFACAQNNLDVHIFDHRDQNIFNTSTINLSYVIPGPCWDDEEKWQHCDVETTLFGSMVGLEPVRKDLAVNWLIDALNQDELGARFNTSKEITDTAWMLFNRFAKDEESSIQMEDNISLSDIERRMVRFLLYNQNNDGSWGNSSDTDDQPIIKTAIAAMAIDQVNNGSFAENLADANNWISDNEPAAGWDTVEKNSLSFLTFSRSAKPFIRSDPLLVYMNNPVQIVQLYNPSSFDFTELEFIVDENLQEYIEVEPIGSLLSDYYKEFTIRQKKKIDKTEYGYITIMNDEQEISKIPVLVQAVPTLNITSPDEVYIFGGKGVVNFRISKSPETLNCDLTWDDVKVTTKSKFTLTNEKTLNTEIIISEVRNQDVTYTGEFLCVHEDTEIEIPVTIDTKQFDSFPFSVNPSVINVSSTEEKPLFTIYNNVDKPIVVDIEFIEEDPYLAIDQQIAEIPPLDKYEITLSSFFVENESVEYTNEIVVSAYGKTETIDVLVSIEATQKRASFVGLIIIFTIVFGTLGAGGYFAYQNKEKLIALIPPQIAAKFNMLPSVKTGGDEEKVDSKNYLHVAELIKIMVGLGQDEDEITKRLKSEGYNDGEINEVFERVKEEMETEEVLEKEEKFMKLMKSLEMDVGTTRSKLKQEGFTDAEIQEAFKQTEDEITKKEKEIKQKLSDEEKYNVSDEEAKTSKSGEKKEE
ncbi:MAG: hypothetical protein ACLFPQ_05400 [Candidatus Woesearchaeota archaeon]